MKQTFPVADVAPQPVSPGDDKLSQGSDSFPQGDQVVMTGGPYWGTSGTFLRLRSDANWADLEEPSGIVRCHPLACISHSSVAPRFTSVSGA
jgi:hypothetical protein